MLFTSSSRRFGGDSSLEDADCTSGCLRSGVERSVRLVDVAIVRKPPRGGLQYDELVNAWREQTKTKLLSARGFSHRKTEPNI